MNPSYGVLNGTTPDRIVERLIEGGIEVIFVSIQHQIKGGRSGAEMSFLPIL